MMKMCMFDCIKKCVAYLVKLLVAAEEVLAEDVLLAEVPLAMCACGGQPQYPHGCTRTPISYSSQSYFLHLPRQMHRGSFIVLQLAQPEVTYVKGAVWFCNNLTDLILSDFQIKQNKYLFPTFFIQSVENPRNTVAGSSAHSHSCRITVLRENAKLPIPSSLGRPGKSLEFVFQIRHLYMGRQMSQTFFRGQNAFCVTKRIQQ